MMTRDVMMAVALTATVAVAALPVGSAGRNAPEAPLPAPAVEAPAPEPAPGTIAPLLKAVAVKKVVASDQPQVVSITGQGFEQGMTATLTSLNEIVAFGPTSIGLMTPTSMALTMTLPAPGTYDLTVRTRGGRVSNKLAITVAAK
jgi:hypothetical protein